MIVNLLNPQSLDDAIKRLREDAKRIKKAKMEIARRLAEIGVEVVKVNFASATSFDKIGGYKVNEPVKTENGYIVEAVGDRVVFIEFGSGLGTQDYEHEGEGLPPIYPGSYSQTEGAGMFIPGEHEYWFYRRRLYRGTPSAHGFHQAKEQIIQQAREIAREELGKL